MGDEHGEMNQEFSTDNDTKSRDISMLYIYYLYSILYRIIILQKKQKSRRPRIKHIYKYYTMCVESM